MNAGEAFLGLLEAAIKDAAIEKKVTFLQITIDAGGVPATVRVVTLPEDPVTRDREEVQEEMARVLEDGDGFHYSGGGLRIVVMREVGTHQFPPGMFEEPGQEEI